MDRLSETLRNAKKPILAIYEEYCASAAYYIGCHGQKLYATTSHDFVGCIGTMCSFWNFEPYFEKLGLKKMPGLKKKPGLRILRRSRPSALRRRSDRPWKESDL